MKRFLNVCLFTALAMNLGCQALNTGIRQNGPNSYTITSVNAGFLRVYGSVDQCEADGSTMTCTKIDSE